MASPVPRGFFDDLDDADALLILRLQLEDSLEFVGDIGQAPGAATHTDEQRAFQLAGDHMIRDLLALRDHAVAVALANSDQMHAVQRPAPVAGEPVVVAVQNGKIDRRIWQE